MRLSSLRLLVLFPSGVLVALANVAVPPPPFSDKELAQGFSDRVILAKPHARHRATVDSAESRENVRVRDRLPRLGDLRIIEVPAGESVDAVIKRLQATGRYEFVERDALMKPDATPNDPSFPAQWSLNNTGQLLGSTPGADIKAVAAWDIIREAPNVVVAVIDNGINVTHRDLVPNLWRNPAPTIGDVNGIAILGGVRSTNISDQTGHGSHVAGIIGAAGNNGFNMAGVAWRVQLMIVKNSDASGSSSQSDSALCVDYAIANGAHVINCSFGGTSFSQTFFTALKAARDAGVIVVCAAGNDGLNNDTSPHYPASYALDNLVSVGNSDPTDFYSFSSDYGGLVELFAPGTSITSLDLTATGQTVRSGTSMAAPHVTGSMALLKAQFPTDTPRQLINRLLRGVDRLNAFRGQAQTGGRLNLLRALSGTVNRPFNDEFANRGVLLGSGASIRSNNTGATPETGEPAHAGTAATTTLWWQWAATATGNVTVSTTGSDYDTVLAVYTGTTLANLVAVASNDDAGGAKTSAVTFPAVSGTTYLLAVGGKNGAAGLTYMSLGTAPTNDDFAGATSLASAESVQAISTNLHGSAEPAEPAILGVPASSSSWFRWTAPRAGRFQVAAFSFVFDSMIAVYTGSDVKALTLVAAGDDTGVDGVNTDSLATFTAQAGVTYSIKVDSKDALRGGAFTLSLTDSLWQFAGEGYATGAPAVATDGTIYFGGGVPDPYFYAVKPDGTLRWRYRAPESVDNASPALTPDGTIIFGTFDGTVTALAPDGTLRWANRLSTGNVSVSPAIGIDGTAVLHLADGTLVGLDAATGTVRWRTQVSATTFASPVIGRDGTIYQVAGTSAAGGLVALTPGGTIKWRFAVPSDSFSTPAIDAAGNIYFTSYTTSRLYCVRPDGTERWNYAAAPGSLTSTSPTLSADGSVAYFGSTNRFFHAINTADGTLRWRVTLPTSLLASTAAVDATGTIYVGCYDYRLYAINPTGTIKRLWDTGYQIRSSPTIIGRTLYVASGDGKLYALDIGAEAAPGAWTQYRQNARRTGRVEGGEFAVALAPQPVNVVATQPFDVSVGVTANAAVTFQWSKNGVPIPGATFASIPFATATAADAGSYSVVVTSGGRSLTAPAVAVTVEALLAPRFANFSVRAAPGAAPRMLIVGFTVGPGAAKPTLLRGVGPTLAAFGLTTALADPSIVLATGATIVQTNDNWAGDAAITAAAARIGAFQFAPTSADAAILRTLAPGSYTLQVLPATGTTGVALGEVYDLDPVDAETPPASRLRNLSARAQVGVGTELLVAGLTITGNLPKRVLIRAAGPALAAFGVTGTLADPILEVFRGATSLGRNDDWLGATAIVTAAAQAGAFPFASLTSRDSALVLTLAPGSYSLQVTGFAGTSGVALLEVYELP
ncbi:MAG: hypothetical protein RLZZ15_1952 [Verrucomicrobiota bacterium]|jgi:outer membrane protein assembly factor BamB